MNIQKLRDELIADEARINFIYSDKDGKPTWPGRKIIDPETKKLIPDGNPTFGIGHKLTPKDLEWSAWKKLQPGGKLSVSEKRIDEVFESDIQICLSDCHNEFPDFNIKMEELQLIIANMMFNLGRAKFAGFEKFILAVKVASYLTAAAEMRDSDWWREGTHNRAERLRKRMYNLAFPSKMILVTKEECDHVINEKNQQLNQKPS